MTEKNSECQCEMSGRVWTRVRDIACHLDGKSSVPSNIFSNIFLFCVLHSDFKFSHNDTCCIHFSFDQKMKIHS